MRPAIALVLALGQAQPVAAQDEAIASDHPVAEVGDEAALSAFEAAVPPMPWYPQDYYDVRIAAEAQVADSIRGDAMLVQKCPTGEGRCYDLSDPVAERVDAGEEDPALLKYGNIALEIARLRQEMAQAGYPQSVYLEPLLAYERALLDEAAAKQPQRKCLCLRRSSWLPQSRPTGKKSRPTCRA